MTTSRPARPVLPLAPSLAPALALALAVAGLAVLGAGCLAGAEARSLAGGRRLFADRPPAAPPPERRAEYEARLAAAEAERAADPGSEEAWIWSGRRLAYLGRYRDAIALYSEALGRFPASHRLLRHRGHRWITVRELDRAVADLERAAELVRDLPDEIEPDGMPNARGIPRSTTSSNVFYHLGLAHYLRRDFERAAEAYATCLEYSRVNDDMLCATSYWSWLTLARLGRAEEAAAVLAPIRADMDVIENHAYHRLLLAYRGELDLDGLLEGLDPGGVEFATVGYGVGMGHLRAGRPREAQAAFERVVAGPAWPAFGHLAAEAELAAGP